MGLVGGQVERYGLRTVHRHGHVAELLFTFGLAYEIVEMVQVIWGRITVPYAIPSEMDGPLFTLFTTTFPTCRGFMMLVAADAAVDLPSAKAHGHRPGDSGCTHTPRVGGGAWAQCAAGVHAGLRWGCLRARYRRDHGGQRRYEENGSTSLRHVCLQL